MKQKMHIPLSSLVPSMNIGDSIIPKNKQIVLTFWKTTKQKLE